MDQLRKDAQALCASWDEWVVEGVNAAAFSVTIVRNTDDDQNNITVTVTASYPRGPIKLFDSISEHKFESRDLALSAALDCALETWYNDESEGMHEGSSTLFEQAVTAGGVDEVVIPSVLADVEAQVKAAVADIRLRNLCWALFEPTKRKWTVRIGCALTALNNFRAKALGIDNVDILVVEFRWPWKYIRETDTPEIADVYTCPARMIGASSENAERHLGALRWYLRTRLETAIGKNHVLQDRRRMNYTEADDAEWAERARFQPSVEAENFYPRGEEENILVGLQRFIEYRISVCTAHCLICDAPLAHAGLKLAVCDKDLCQHSAQNYGLGCDVVHELERNGMVSELLISLSLAAAQAGQAGRDVFVPMCPVHIADNTFPGYSGPRHFYIGSYGTGTKNFKLLNDSIQQLPTVKQMVRDSEGKDETLKKKLDATSPLLFPLLRWILSSNRAHIEPIPKHLRIKDMGEYQFHLISSNPSKEARFLELKAAAKKRSGASKTGSFYVWHGSSPGNWHCIARAGLKNYSNTKFMSAGAAYGPGIYTARNTSISLGYMGSPSTPWTNAEYIGPGKGLQLISLCELVDDQRETSAVTGKPSLRDASADIVTIQDEDLIDTRFLFVFAGGQTCSNNLHANNVQIPADLLHA